MLRKLLVCCMLGCIYGCSGPTFTHLGNGVGVPAESIDEFAEAKGISRGEAKKQIIAERNQQPQTHSGD